MSEHFCERRVGRIAPRECGRKAVEEIDGRHFCKRCASVERKVVANRAQKWEDEAALDRRRAELSTRMNKAARMLHLSTASLDTFGAGLLTGRVNISLEELESLAQKQS